MMVVKAPKDLFYSVISNSPPTQPLQKKKFGGEGASGGMT
jgi:hypothetical protein